MNPFVKKLLGVLLVIAAFIATIVLYRNGTISGNSVIMLLIVLLIPLFNMVNILIQEWKNKR